MGDVVRVQKMKIKVQLEISRQGSQGPKIELEFNQKIKLEDPAALRMAMVVFAILNNLISLVLETVGSM